MLLHNRIPITLPLPIRKPTHHRNAAVSATASFSVSDESLSSRGFTFHRTIDNLNLDHLNSVFAAVGFPRRDPEKIRVALEHTDALLWIEYEKTRRPVAFARATGGVFNAIIWDVVVDPTFQGIGLGKAVMERLVTELLEKGINNIALYSEPRCWGSTGPWGLWPTRMALEGWSTPGSRKQKIIMKLTIASPLQLAECALSNNMYSGGEEKKNLIEVAAANERITFQPANMTKSH
ncbi:UNVERIFIED_CONTAM: Serotonin N-acetyltransferase 2, chloroplastic [Sesamum latifolium]|uniref:Serotonin N-acetyltransferase 2, chloroplastic n=1 Tax=Sesamum latifolium TaxID=2727402 RepID=A0AAW2YDR0_9LAMI